MAIDQDDHFLVAGSSRRDDDLLHVAVRVPAVIAGVVLSIGSGARARKALHRSPPCPTSGSM